MTLTLQKNPEQPTQELRPLESSDKQDGTKLFRFDGMNYHPYVRLSAYSILSETPKGMWIDFHGRRKFVLKDARKKFAYSTLEEARTSFLARKRRHIAILEGQLEDARISKSMLEQNQFLDCTKFYYI